MHAQDEPRPAATLRAGAGRAEIELPAELFPTEGFRGVHDALHARVLLLQCHKMAALLSIELPSLPQEQVTALQEMVGEAAGLPPEDVWISVTHTLSAPHFVPERMCKAAADQEKNHLLAHAIRAAVGAAASQAVTGMEDARFGCETGFCDVNVNRDVFTEDGWWLGCNETGPSDKSVIVLRFETLAGDPIALLFGYGVRPAVMEEPPTTGGARLVTADLAGAASRFVEQEYGDAVTAVFCMGAAGDQAPSLKGARFQYVGKDGRSRVRDIDERGFVIAEMLGARLGAEVLHISERTKCQALAGSIVVARSMVRCPGQKMTTGTHSLRPSRHYAFVPAEVRDEPVEVITLGDVALVGVCPELGCQTAVSIREQSPFRDTIVLTMVNGSAKYMADLSAYDRITYEAMNSPFARGSAELMCEKVVELLRSAHNGDVYTPQHG
jgi:neutral ceramidase